MSRAIRYYDKVADFPRRQETPTFRYMIATVPRTGSTYLALLLWRTGVLGAPMEYINLHNQKNIIARLGNGDPVKYWEEVQRVRTSPNGVFGYKAFMQCMEHISKTHPELLGQIASDQVIYLTRKNKIAQAVSYSKAWRTKSWFSFVPETETADYDFDHIARCEAWIAYQEAFWEKAFAMTGTPPLRVYYEDVAENGQGAVQSVLQFLGVTPNTHPPIFVPMISQQADSVSADWIARYAAERTARTPARPREAPDGRTGVAC